MSDGGENVRRMQEYLHPHSEHLIDWFHNTMRLTVLQQQTKALQEERPPIGGKVSKQLESIKNLLWHGNVEEALERVANLTIDLAPFGPTRRPRKAPWQLQSLIHTSVITRSSSPISGSAGGKGKRSARHLWNRPLTRW